MKKQQQPLSLAIGTEIALTKRTSATWSNWLKTNDALIVTDVSCGSGSLEYAVNGCAWFMPDEVAFVSEPTKKSVAYACQIGAGEDSEDEEDEETGKPIKRKKIKLRRDPAASKMMDGLKLKHR